MASENHFVYPQNKVSIPRSTFPFNHRVLTSMIHGDLVPLEITEILPGDTMKYRLKTLVRMSTPIAPIMDNIFLSVACFFVSKRLVNDNVKKFYGETTEGYGVQSDIIEPTSSLSTMSVYKADATNCNSSNLATQLGIVRQVSTASPHLPIALNPIRSFLQVYNDWFRSEVFDAPYLWDHSQTGDSSSRYLATLNGSNVAPGTMSLPKVCKKMDRFTSCLPWAQKLANPVLLPLGTNAPVFAGPSNMGSSVPQNPIHFYGTGYSSGTMYAPAIVGDAGGAKLQGTTAGASGTVNTKLYPDNLYADLSQATAATINQIRMAFATQRYYEALARSGSKYREYMLNIFGVSIGDTTAQMSEYLGGCQININIDQVLSTNDYAAGSTTKLGATGAYSCTGADEYLFTKSFVEPGYLVIVAYTKHSRTYGQGIDDVFTKNSLFDYYNPKFANIGENTQGSLKRNLYFTGAASDTTPFGFNEAWCDYHFKKDECRALLNPAISNSLNYWNLSENFANAPTLSSAFIKEDRTNLARALTTGTSGPDYICDFYFEAQAVRPMPLHSIPGLVDHF